MDTRQQGTPADVLWLFKRLQGVPAVTANAPCPLQTRSAAAVTVLLLQGCWQRPTARVLS